MDRVGAFAVLIALRSLRADAHGASHPAHRHSTSHVHHLGARAARALGHGVAENHDRAVAHRRSALVVVALGPHTRESELAEGGTGATVSADRPDREHHGLRSATFQEQDCLRHAQHRLAHEGGLGVAGGHVRHHARVLRRVRPRVDHDGVVGRGVGAGGHVLRDGRVGRGGRVGLGAVRGVAVVVRHRRAGVFSRTNYVGALDPARGHEGHGEGDQNHSQQLHGAASSWCGALGAHGLETSTTVGGMPWSYERSELG